jgi:streptogramin lyase
MRRGIRVSVVVALAAGTLLATASGSSAIVITEFSPGISPGANPYGITAGPDGSMWFAEQGGNHIGRIRPSDGSITEFSQGVTAISREITAGPDGKIWFTEDTQGVVGRLDPQTGIAQEHPVVGRHPYGIVGGPDGNVWFTNSDPGAPKVARLSPSFGYAEFPPNPATLAAPATGIAHGPDGNLWATEPARIARVTPSGAVTEFNANGNPIAITTGSDGALWFLEYTANKIGRITTSGVVTNEFPVSPHDAGLGHITAGPDGNLWFTDGAKVGRMTPSGASVEFGGFSGPVLQGIAGGLDGNLWVSESAGRIARVIPDVPPEVSTGAATNVAVTTATLLGAVRARGVSTTYHFEYGTSAASLTGTAPTSAGSGDTALAVAASATGLAPATSYVYRLVATNANGTTAGPFVSFRTGPAPPPPRLRISTTGGWTIFDRGVRIGSMTVKGLVAGAKLKLSCPSCHVRQTITAKGSRVKLKKLRRKLLRRGKGFTITATKPGYLGDQLTLTVKRYGHTRAARNRIADAPFKVKHRCLPVGASRPGRC